MILSDAAIDKRTSVLVLALIITVFGAVSYLALPRESEPDVTPPFIYITTMYPGVAPEDIEQSITIPIEKKLKGLENVKHIQSSSTEGMSSISIEFLSGIDIDEALQKTKDKVDLAKSQLPSDLDSDPNVREQNFSEQPIVVFSLSGTCGLVRLKEIAENLEDDIESVPGVLEAEVSGGLEREIRVEPIPDKLAYFGLSLMGLQQVISKENRNVSGGNIRMGDGRFQLRVPGEFKTPEEIYGLVVGLHQGNPVYLKDVARVIDGFKDENGRSRLNGLTAINIQVKKRSGENILKITDLIDEIVEKQQKTWPPDTQLNKTMDSAKRIRLIVEDLENHVFTGMILVSLVLLFVMGVRNAIMVGLAIPFSMFISFMVIHALGMTLNMVTLFSLTLTLGLLVDDAIVIAENIFRFMQQGVPRIQAAKRATSEVAPPVIASTLTTVAAFIPLMFWPGMMGQFMFYLPLMVIITLLSSLFVAMVINPAMAAFFLKIPSSLHSTEEKTSDEDIAKAGEAPIAIRSAFMRRYRQFLEKALDHRYAVLAMVFFSVVVMAMIWLYRVGIEKPIEFMPATDPQSLYINIDMPEGADLDYSDRVTRQIELAICEGGNSSLSTTDPAQCYNSNQDKKVHVLAQGQKVIGLTDLANLKDIYSRAVATAGSSPGFGGGNAPNHIGIQFHDLVDRVESSPKTIETIRERTKNVPGARITIRQMEMGPPTGVPINIEISGDSYEVLGQISRQVLEVLEKTPFVQDITDNYISGSPTIRVKVDRQKAALMGLSTDVIGFLLKIAFNGIKVSTYREGDEDFDITVQLPAEDRKKTDILRELLIPTPNGLVPLSTVTQFEVTGGLGRINRVNHERTITVSANVDKQQVPPPVVRAQVEKLLKKAVLPPGYSIRFTGENEFQQEAESFLSKAFLVAIFLIFLILIYEFNSVAQPLIIITSVFLSLGGVFLGLFVFNMSFGVIMTGIGVISLAGVVVKNAIVLIDYTNKLHQRGFSYQEAIIAAGCTRLRPVLLTAITAVLGLLPMMTGVSFDFHTMSISWVNESTQMWQPMATAVIFGLSLATVLTLVVVPCLCSIVYTGSLATQKGVKSLRRAYWAPFYRLTGSRPSEE